jgi:hypothetical protein
MMLGQRRRCLFFATHNVKFAVVTVPPPGCYFPSHLSFSVPKTVPLSGDVSSSYDKYCDLSATYTLMGDQ